MMKNTFCPIVPAVPAVPLRYDVYTDAHVHIFIEGAKVPDPFAPLLTGSEDKWDYYGKVIDVDSTRVVTVMLRYYPEHSEAVEPIREWVNNFDARR